MRRRGTSCLSAVTIACAPVSSPSSPSNPVPAPGPASDPESSRARSRPRLLVVGVVADGWPGIPDRLRDRILAADVVLGGARHLDLLPQLDGQVRERWPSPLRAGLPALVQRYVGRRVVVLASGDPFVSGIAT